MKALVNQIIKYICFLYSWNNLYNDEIENFQNHGDVGEIWFGKETVKRIVKWISENPLIKKNDSILDLGKIIGFMKLWNSN